MFKDRISNTPMTTAAANDFFRDTINGQTWNSDNSFIATLRALLAPRLKEGDVINLAFTKSNYNKSSVDELPAPNAVRHICDAFYDNNNELHIHNFYNTDDEANDAWMRVFEANFERQYEGWHRVEKVTVFFRKVFEVLCFINPDRKSVILFTNNMNVQKMHYLQCGIFAFLPWYFDQEAGVTALEMELISSLREKKSDHYLDCLTRIASQYDFNTARVKRLLKGFETSFERRRCDQIKADINNLIRSLRSLDQQYADILKNKTEAETMLLGLELKINNAGDESEIMDYFLSNRHLVLKNVEGSMMEFIVRAPLDYFDEDMARRCIRNDGSYFYSYAKTSGPFTVENLRMLWDAIFLKQRFKIQFCSAYRFRMEGTVESLSGYDGYGADCCEYTPNPHIDRYNCMGNYKKIINERLKEHDYIGALEQCIASCKSLNIGDSPVMNEFAARFCERSGGDKNMRCIVMPDGTVKTPREAIEWLVAEKEEKEKAEREAAAAVEAVQEITEEGAENG